MLLLPVQGRWLAPHRESWQRLPLLHQWENKHLRPLGMWLGIVPRHIARGTVGSPRTASARRRAFSCADKVQTQQVHH